MNSPCITYLYRAKDAEGHLLYVGVTQWPSMRMENHAQGSAWYALAANIDYVEFPNRAAALAAELAEIRSLRPPYNIAGNPDFMNPLGDDAKGISIRMQRSQWACLMAVTVAQNTKIQPYLVSLIQADFDKRGLPF